MIRPTLALAALTGLLIAPACGDADSGPVEYTHSADAYFPETFEADYTQIYACEASPTHGGDHVTVYISPDAEPAWLSGMDPIPEGGILLKAQYSDSSCTTLSAYTVMRKGAAGTAPDSGDWEWQRVNASGSVSGSGQMSACISCHQSSPTVYYTSPGAS